MSNAEKISLIVGLFALIPLFLAVSFLANPPTEFEDVVAILMILLHFMMLAVSFPFLLKAANQAQLSENYKIIIKIIALINSIQILLILFYLPNTVFFGYLFFAVLAIVELVPFHLLRPNI